MTDQTKKEIIQELWDGCDPYTSFSDIEKAFEAGEAHARKLPASTDITVREDGEANVYRLMRAGKWLARIQFNGELVVEQQRDILNTWLGHSAALATQDAQPVLPDHIERMKFELRQAMIEYGSAIKNDHKAGIAETSERGCALVDELAALAAQQAGEPVAWEAATPFYTKYITDSRYQKFSPEVQRWYKPYRCTACAHAPATPQAEPSGRDVLHQVFALCEDTEDKPVPLGDKRLEDFTRGRQFEAKSIRKTIGTWHFDTVGAHRTTPPPMQPPADHLPDAKEMIQPPEFGEVMHPATPADMAVYGRIAGGYMQAVQPPADACHHDQMVGNHLPDAGKMAQAVQPQGELSEGQQIIRDAVAAMPATNPMVADDLIAGRTMHTDADDIVAIWRTGVEEGTKLEAGWHTDEVVKLKCQIDKLQEALASRAVQPMSDEQRHDLAETILTLSAHDSRRNVVLRAIGWTERHHGITQPQPKRATSFSGYIETVKPREGLDWALDVDSISGANQPQSKEGGAA